MLLALAASRIVFICCIFCHCAVSVNTSDTEIKAQRVVGVGFGNIFAAGQQISLRPHAPKPAAETNHQHPVREPIKPSQVNNTAWLLQSAVITYLHTYLHELITRNTVKHSSNQRQVVAGWRRLGDEGVNRESKRF